MAWLKETIIDVLVTICIALATLQDLEWARWVVWIYTPFMLLLKIGVYFGPTVVKRGKKEKTGGAPDWVFHLLYGANVVLLLAAQWWLVAAGWAAIWLISYLGNR
ncbi:MAG: hypothetical protein R3282_08090 [Rhodothermales bacterium]|nr:hypothetical protein [Rhodothermales bacterium]